MRFVPHRIPRSAGARVNRRTVTHLVTVCSSSLSSNAIEPGPCRDWLLSAFGATEQAAVASYRRFVAEGIGQAGPWEQLRHQMFLGSEAFVENLRRRLPTDRDLSEVPRAQRRPPAKPLAEYAALYPDRDEAIAAAYASGGYTLKDIGQYFGLHYARVSRIVRGATKAKGKT
jgi:putative transposase